MIVWGTSFGSHDAALAVYETSNNTLLFASHSERFSKKKDDPNLCQQLVDHAVRTYGAPRYAFYYEKPMLKKLRYLRSGQFGNLFEKSPKKVLRDLGVDIPVLPTEHHRSHAAAGYFTSGFGDATVVVIDAIGELATLTIWTATHLTMQKVYQQNYPHSVGLLYSALTEACGFKPNGEEYIFMGLSAHGDPSVAADDLESRLVDLNGDQRLISLKKNLHKGARRFIPDNISKEDLAAAGQEIYERILKRILEKAWTEFPSRNLVLMGGCALNCVANSKIRSWHSWDGIWIMPNPGDAGSAIGAILANTQSKIKWKSPYLGLSIGKEYPVDGIVKEIMENGMVAVANGPAEFGPRALGNRSLLADPRISDMKDRMNWVKRRERFRPFAAAIPEELAGRYFDMSPSPSSPYMQYVYKCLHPEKFPGIVHVDGTSRIQTVSASQHKGLHEVLMKWHDQTGCPMLVNTSLNIKNQPLVNDLADAVEFQERYGIRVLT